MGEHSVNPYPSTRPPPVSRSNFSATDSGNGAAPEMHALIDPRSYFRASSASLSVRYSRGTPGKNVGFSRWISFRHCFRSNRGSIASFAARRMPTFIATVPNEWKNGRTHMMQSSPGRMSEMHPTACIAFDTRLKCESVAPLDRPVVPPV